MPGTKRNRQFEIVFSRTRVGGGRMGWEANPTAPCSLRGYRRPPSEKGYQGVRSPSHRALVSAVPFQLRRATGMNSIVAARETRGGL
jgi:hypothetical protein